MLNLRPDDLHQGPQKREARGDLQKKQRGLVALGVIALLAALVLHLTLSVSRESPTWDEGNHIFAGYWSLTHADFGLNPEHPPVVKMLAAAPLLSMPLKVPEVRNRFFMHEAFLDGKEFLFSNDADAMMFRARMTASITARYSRVAAVAR